MQMIHVKYNIYWLRFKPESLQRGAGEHNYHPVDFKPGNRMTFREVSCVTSKEAFEVSLYIYYSIIYAIYLSQRPIDLNLIDSRRFTLAG